MDLAWVINQVPQIQFLHLYEGRLTHDPPMCAFIHTGVFPQVLVLSTRLLRPTDIAELLFATPRLSPDIGV